MGGSGLVLARAVACEQVAALMARGLVECGLDVPRTGDAVGQRLEIRGIPAAPVSSLVMTNDAVVRWECGPAASWRQPERTADIVTALLTGQAPPYERVSDGFHAGLSYKGTVGRELQARGFDVELVINHDEHAFEAWADISVRREKSGMRALVDDAGCITWDADYAVMHSAAGLAPGVPAASADIEDIARDVVARLRRVASV